MSFKLPPPTPLRVIRHWCIAPQVRNPCASRPCQNDGSCLAEPAGSGVPGNYRFRWVCLWKRLCVGHAPRFRAAPSAKHSGCWFLQSYIPCDWYSDQNGLVIIKFSFFLSVLSMLYFHVISCFIFHRACRFLIVLILIKFWKIAAVLFLLRLEPQGTE